MITRSGTARPSIGWRASTVSRASCQSASMVGANPTGALGSRSSASTGKNLSSSDGVILRAADTHRVAAARLLRTRRQAHLCGPSRYGDARGRVRAPMAASSTTDESFKAGRPITEGDMNSLSDEERDSLAAAYIASAEVISSAPKGEKREEG